VSSAHGSACRSMKISSSPFTFLATRWQLVINGNNDMKAIGYKDAGPLDRADALVDIELDRPIPGTRDLLVEVEAISVNPVDTKVRKAAQPKDGDWKVLGWDVAGTVVEVGLSVTLFNPGDKVF